MEQSSIAPEAEKLSDTANILSTDKKSSVKLPEIKEFLKAGVQFGHEAKRWNPAMHEYIFAKKNGIHIIDLSKTLPLLELAANFLAEKYVQGPIIFLGTKRQASEILTEVAEEVGVHYITNRWAGGLLTNFPQIQKSIKQLNDLEKQFEEGIVGRTKYEVSKMKKDWEKLTRLYGGIKQLKQRPVAVFVIDPGFEAGAIRECNYLDIPLVAMVDTNSDPSIIDYPIPANDDAIGSIKLVVNYIKERLNQVESPYKVAHAFKDYNKVDVIIKKTEGALTAAPVAAMITTSTEEEIKNIKLQAAKLPVRPEKNSKQIKQEEKDAKKKQIVATKATVDNQGGILGRFQEEKNKKLKTAKK